MMRHLIFSAAAVGMLVCTGLAAEAAPLAGAATQMHNGIDPGASVTHVEWYWRNHHRYWRGPPRHRAPPRRDERR